MKCVQWGSLMKINISLRPLQSGKQSIYLDYRIGKKRVREPLKLFLSGNKRKTPNDKETLELARKICSKREHEINTGQHGFVSKKQQNADFVEYFSSVTDEETRKFESGEKTSRTYSTYQSALKHLEAFTGGRVQISAINEQWLENMRSYLLKKLPSQTTASTYFSKIRAVINKAYRNRLLNYNPVENVKTIAKKDSEKVFLVEDELKTLINTPCEKEGWKRAFIFCCFTGLRLGDMKSLTWDKIKEGNKLHFRQDKTDGFEYLKLHKNALDILELQKGPNIKGTDKVFNLDGEAHRNDYLRQWTTSAGINKHITFHSSRHTFATLLLTQGVDLYTVSKLLGHSDFKTTIIYAKIIDKVRDGAIDSLPVISID